MTMASMDSETAYTLRDLLASGMTLREITQNLSLADFQNRYAGSEEQYKSVVALMKDLLQGQHENITKTFRARYLVPSFDPSDLVVPLLKQIRNPKLLATDPNKDDYAVVERVLRASLLGDALFQKIKELEEPVFEKVLFEAEQLDGWPRGSYENDSNGQIGPLGIGTISILVSVGIGAVLGYYAESTPPVIDKSGENKL